MAGLEVVVANGRAPNNALERTAGSHTLAARPLSASVRRTDSSRKGTRNDKQSVREIPEQRSHPARRVGGGSHGSGKRAHPAFVHQDRAGVWRHGSWHHQVLCVTHLPASRMVHGGLSLIRRGPRCMALPTYCWTHLNVPEAACWASRQAGSHDGLILGPPNSRREATRRTARSRDVRARESRLTQGGRTWLFSRGAPWSLGLSVPSSPWLSASPHSPPMPSSRRRRIRSVSFFMAACTGPRSEAYARGSALPVWKRAALGA